MGIKTLLVVGAVALVFGFAGTAAAGILLEDQFRGVAGAQGTAGPPGPPGPPGQRGPQGAPGAHAEIEEAEHRIEALEKELQALTGRITRVEIDGLAGRDQLELTEFGCHTLNGVKVVTDVETFYDSLQVEKSFNLRRRLRRLLFSPADSAQRP